MKKQDIVLEVARQTGISKANAKALVKVVLDSLVDSLHQGEDIELRGFGTFRFHERASHRRRNPKTGAEVTIPAGQAIRFKPGKELICALNVASESEDA